MLAHTKIKFSVLDLIAKNCYFFMIFTFMCAAIHFLHFALRNPIMIFLCGKIKLTSRTLSYDICIHYGTFSHLQQYAREERLVYFQLINHSEYLCILWLLVVWAYLHNNIFRLFDPRSDNKTAIVNKSIVMNCEPISIFRPLCQSYRDFSFSLYVFDPPSINKCKIFAN